MSFLPPPRLAGGPAPVLIRRPSALTLAFVGALLIGLSSVIAGVLLIGQARHLAEQTAVDLLSGEGLAGMSVDRGAVDQATTTLTAHGALVLASGVLVLAFAFAARAGATWGRTGLGLLLLGTVCGNGLAVTDVAPAATRGLGVVAMALSLAVAALLFLPATNRYASARKRMT